MSDTLTTNLDKPITAVKVLTAEDAEQGLNLKGSATSAVKAMQGLDAQKAAFSQTCQILKDLISKLNQFYDRVFSEHREAIAKLSVEIARKVLVQKVRDGDYEIESIVKEALKNAPSRRDIVVHLNPGDLERCQKAQQDEQNGMLSGIKFVSDPDVGQAECVLESPKGIIKSLIDEHLEQIVKSLKKVE